MFRHDDPPPTRSRQPLQEGHPLAVTLEHCIRRAQGSGEPQLLAVRRRIPFHDPLRAWADWEERGVAERFYWARPADGVALAARGAVRRIEIAGPERFALASRAVREIFAALVVSGDDAPEWAGPLCVGGFAFDAEPPPRAGQDEWERFGAASLLLPELLLVAARSADTAWCTVVREIRPGAEPGRELKAIRSQLEAARQWAEPARRKGQAAGAAAGGSPPECHADFAPGAEYRVTADRPHAVYRSQVRGALAAVARGELEKVVLARSLMVVHPGRFALAPLLARLSEQYPACTTLAVGRGEDTLIAASPERLVALAGDGVETGALAGTAPRGRSPEEDARLGRALSESKKEQAEHEAVVRAVRAALAEACGALYGPEAPELLRVEGIQHLHTPLRGRLRTGSGPRPDVISLLARLHPTPAVGGLPGSAALAWLRRNEGLARGWYAGAVGFVGADGGGEFWVALRAALVRNGAGTGEPARARLFAGAGIVEGSDPEQELGETRLKLRALLAPLTEI